jgi:hypothetical protein
MICFWDSTNLNTTLSLKSIIDKKRKS